MHRWRGQSEPFWIEVRGKYLEPKETAVELRGKAADRRAEVFAGTIETLQGDLDRVQ